jgi:PAS domain S-box-containing protein
VNTPGYVGVTQDPTERQRIEEKLRLQSAALEAAAVGIVISNLEGTILWVNSTFTALTGYTAEQAVGRNPRILKSGKHHQPFYGDIWDTILAGHVWHGELTNRRKDGTLYDAEMTITPVLDESGAIRNFIAIMQDVTERKQAEEERRFRNAILSTQMETSIDGILVIGRRNDEILSYNQRFVDMWELPPAVIESGSDQRTLESILSKLLDPNAFLQRVKHLNASRKETSHEEISLRDGRTLDRYSAPMLGSDGQYYGRIWYFRDITARQRAEEKLRLILADLGRSNKDLEQFAYVASHDLQEPLRMVSSYTQLLARRYQGQLDATADKYIGYAVDGANRMQSLIEDLLAYSRVGTRAKGFGPVDCTAVLDQALANLKVAIEKSGAVVTHDPLPSVVHDNLLLVQLFQNLIGNAIKFQVETPPRIHVSVEEKGAEWVFAVGDNGIGIDPQYAERIFTIFQRLHTNEEYSGTGIGLAICKKIVERRGGRIWVESRPGTGSTFYFTVPTGGDGL